MIIRYRQVAFGTRFTMGDRQARPEGEARPEVLHGNEVAVDVGGACHGCNTEQWIFDHHFTRPDQADHFPCAAVAVLHNLPLIREHFKAQAEVWIVTHRSPDFDAMASAYLVRKALEAAGDIVVEAAPFEGAGIRIGPDWKDPAGRDRINWFRPDWRLTDAAPGLRWPVLLAAFAACVDQCVRVACRRDRNLNAMLIAARYRGRPLPDLAHAFFEEARAAMERGLNPLFDSLFEEHPGYQPELRMLERQAEAYERDIRRAETFLAILDVDPEIGAWHERIEGARSAGREPDFLDRGEGGVEANPLSWPRTGAAPRVADGLFLTDPECLFFKDWVRDDIDNSSLKDGFLFTAIADTREKRPFTTYYLSVDLQRARGANLYRLWARLQAAELTELRRRGVSVETGVCRSGFQKRARGFERYFDKRWVWFDGHNFDFTLVQNGDGGTLLQSDPDPFSGQVGRIVREVLEYGFFEGEPAVVDLPLADRGAHPVFGTERVFPLREAVGAALGRRCFRHVAVKLRPDVSLNSRQIGRQIGRLLLPFLQERDVTALPPDFEERHLDIQHDGVIVLNRAGMAVAFKDGRLQGVRAQLEELASVHKGLQGLLSPGPDRLSEDLRKEGFQLLRRIVELQFQSIEPQQRHLRLFMELTHAERLAHAIHSLNTEASRAIQERQNADEAVRDKRMEKMVMILGGVFVLPSLLLAFFGVNIKGYTEEVGVSLTTLLYFTAGSIALGIFTLAIVWKVMKLGERPVSPSVLLARNEGEKNA